MALTARRQIFGWCVYDLANTIYSFLFVTLFFPLFVKETLGGTEAHIGIVTSIATICSAIAVPFVGAWSDQVGRRMPFIIAATIGCCTAVGLISISNLAFTLVLAAVSNFFYSVATAVYDALLPKVAPPGKQGAVSGYGVALGYVGTPVGTLAAFAVLSTMGMESELGRRIIFALTGALFFTFALYTFYTVREPKTPSGRSVREEMAAAARSLWTTVRLLPSVKGFLPFLLGAFLVSNGIFAVIVFFALYMREEYGLGMLPLLGVFQGFSVTAALGGLGFGWLTDRWNAWGVLLTVTAMWLAALGVMYLSSGIVLFLVAGGVGGMALGGFWTAVRPQLAKFAQPAQMGEYFGFLALMNKASAAIGPLVFGVVTTYAGYATATLVLMGFFALALPLLWRGRPM